VLQRWVRTYDRVKSLPYLFSININLFNCSCNSIFIVFIVYSVSFIVCVVLCAVFLFECGVLFCVMCYMCVVSYCTRSTTATRQNPHLQF
jgi:hypothetical protein